MPNSYEGVLANIPGLGGYIAGQHSDQQTQLGVLQQAGILSSLRDRAMAQQQEQQLRSALSESGGDLQKALQSTLMSGNVGAASKLAPILESQRKSALPVPGQSIGAGGLMKSDGTIVPPAPHPVAPTKLEQFISIRDRLKAEGKDTTAYDNAIRKESETPRQISPTVNMPRQLQLTQDSKGNTVIVNADGTTTPLRGPDGSPFAGKVPRNPLSDRLATEYTNNPLVKSANDFDQKIEPVVDYMIDFKKTGKSNNAMDMKLARTYLADIRGVGDRAMVMDAKGISSLPNLQDRIGNSISSFFAGKDLTDQTRQEMFDSLIAARKSLSSARDRHKATITGRAKASNIPLDQVFGDQ